MRRFFAERIDEKTARLPAEEARHALTVLRMKTGDECAAILESGLYLSRVSAVDDGVTIEILQELPSPEPRAQVTLYQGLPKGEKMEFIAQKCTEAGVHRIVPVRMSRCVVKLDDRDAAKKTERWQRIAAEAAKQSCRTVVPSIEAPITMERLTARLKAHDLSLVPWEDARGLSLANAVAESPAQDIAIVIGPEGGMEESEVARMKDASALPVTLGPRVFRTETAALASVIMALTVRGEYQ